MTVRGSKHVAVIGAILLSIFITFTEVNGQTKSTDNTIHTAPDQLSLYYYALQLINDDRTKYNLQPVELSKNHAAQAQADDILGTRVLSHWMTDGEKPYMVYTRYGGLGNVDQNVAYQSYLDIEKCRQSLVPCPPADPRSTISALEYYMMYNDAIENWRHQNNILNKYHTDVSLGIAYDNYTSVMVENFEDNYINYTKPISVLNGHIQFAGILHKGKIENIGIYFDPKPSPTEYNLHKNDEFYIMGSHIANVDRPLMPNEYYKKPADYSIIVADRWEEQSGGIDISFDMSSVMNNTGVYTIVIWLNMGNYTLPATSYSIFK